jgi:hypothetical protein
MSVFLGLLAVIIYVYVTNDLNYEAPSYAVFLASHPFLLLDSSRAADSGVGPGKKIFAPPPN